MKHIYFVLNYLYFTIISWKLRNRFFWFNMTVIDFGSGSVAHGQWKLIRTSDFCQIFSIESIYIFYFWSFRASKFESLISETAYLTNPVKIGRLKFFYWKFAVTSFSFFFSFRSKFVLLKIPYFRFVSPKDWYLRITEHMFVVKKKESTYLPTHFQNCGTGKGKQKYF